MNRASGWLLSHRSNTLNPETSPSRRAKTISVTGGKGGVGKTSVSLKLSKDLAHSGKKVLLIDCDYNLSNTAVKLGLPINDNFYDLLTAKKSFDEVVYKEGNFHLLAACNGSYELFESGIEIEKLVIDIVAAHESEYDFIILDSPAGLSKDSLTINAYCDERIVVVTPDRSSITDSYSLIKILNKRFGVTNNHLLLNKVKGDAQSARLIKSLSETVQTFLGCSLNILGAIPFQLGSFDRFDQDLAKIAGSDIQEKFYQMVLKLTEEDIGHRISPFRGMDGAEQEVLSNY